MDRPSVVLPQGQVVGTHLVTTSPHPVEAFLGIPYALPPTEERRFRPAEKVHLSKETIDASKFGPIAPGKVFVMEGPAAEQSEDCLTVNVFRPTGHYLKSSLPVSVYIHGGAFNRGAARSHNTASMVGWSEEPFIGVSFGYRIGALGFLPSSLTKKEGLLNLGLRDQIHLLQWVQENISHFGGNPTQVTLFGLSAGGHSIGHHLLNYKEGIKPLFQRVIMESGSPTSRAVRSYDSKVHEQQFQDLLKEVNCPPNLPETDIFPFLRSLPSSTVTTAQTKIFGKYNHSLRWAFQPVIDGDIISRAPLDAWKAGHWHKVPIMTGFCSNEGTMYVDKKMSKPEQFRHFWHKLLPELSPSDLDTIDRLYPDPSINADSPYIETREGYGLGPQYKRIEAAYAHYAYVAPVRQSALFASPEVKVYLYNWAFPKTVVGRANHGDNKNYETMNEEIIRVSESQKELAETLHSYITSFICRGDPNSLPGRCSDRPQWEIYQAENPHIMVFGQGNEELIGGSPAPPAKFVVDEWAKEETEFWWTKTEISEI